LWWLHYGLLQQGRYAEARRILGVMEADAAASGSRRTRYHLARMRAAHLVETRRWDGDAAALAVDLTGLSPASVAAHHLASGMRAVATGDLAAARAAREAIRAVEDGPAAGQGREKAAIMGLELEALIRHAEGQTEAALALLAGAAEREAALPYEYGPPDIVKPSHELYGELLLVAGRPAEARARFEAALARAPRRALSLLGLARAAEAAGDAEAARTALADLDTVWHRADADVRELLAHR
ncbi:MAG: hypothetical protein D6688_12440, partial [Alphaproteobacteria bacterium]